MLKPHGLILIFLLTACNENFSGGSRTFDPTQEEQQFAAEPVDFRTRLATTLLIAGEQCRGDETTEPYGNGSSCKARQYLITIDNVNVCDESGRCSDFVITPIIGELLNINARNEGTTTFDIIPKSPVSDTQAEILKGVSVTSDLNGNGTVSFKNGSLRDQMKK